MKNRVESEARESGANWTLGSVRGVEFVAPEPEPEGARVWFFTRNGGVSEPPFDSLNISTKVPDDPDAVAENRARIQNVMEGRDLAWVRQVAGDGVVRVREAGLAGEADALITDEEGFSLVVAIADCVPVTLVGGGARSVGMVHSGWRGTIAEISAKAARELGDTSSLRAYIGPCIRQCCYEVSEELAERFAERFGQEVVEGRYLSLPDVIRRNLQEVGVGEVYDLGLCTGCRPDLFFSHRKQGPKTGRNLAAVARLS
ncbi:MAG: polyphenol oxidase family protein [Actinobacteria bacterium]|nr:polyphenol oxidase family protein [Actinomycetota bacterium]MCA1739454.1 polyphenol oxidase family protein [Actinomycetota bacterium]